MASLGQELKRERELRGISLKEISDSTRISLKFLQALEEDRLDVIPGTFFIKAILRSYAKSIGIDEDQVLNKYQEMYTFEEQLQYGESPERPKPRRKPVRRHSSVKKIALAVLLLAILGLVLFLLYFYVLSPGTAPPVKKAAAAPPIQKEFQAPPETEPEPEPVAEQVTEPVAEEVKGLRLEMTFVEQTWLHVYSDGQSVWDGIKAKGESLEVRAEREVRLNLGNAGGADLTINGQKARPLGPSGAVRQDILITLENYADFLAAQEKTG
jgi:cytoskeletal protein RodZ